MCLARLLFRETLSHASRGGDAGGGGRELAECCSKHRDGGWWWSGVKWSGWKRVRDLEASVLFGERDGGVWVVSAAQWGVVNQCIGVPKSSSRLCGWLVSFGWSYAHVTV